MFDQPTFHWHIFQCRRRAYLDIIDHYISSDCCELSVSNSSLICVYGLNWLSQKVQTVQHIDQNCWISYSS